VRIDQDDSWCHSCGEHFPADFAGKLPRLAARQAALNSKPSGGVPGDSWQATGTESELAGPVFEAATPRTRAVMRRYHDAYRVANIIARVGESVKVVGVALAILFGFLGLFSASQVGTAGLFAGLFAAALFGVASWLSGVLVNALGQLLIASLDGAVNGSPFLSDDQRARAMSLPGSDAVVDSPNPAARADA
jgi:hypothetical protein